MGKKKKIVIMSEEERVAFEEQQRLLEEEMRKKKENVLAQFLMDKLMHEERATQYNLNKLNLQWRAIMRGEKTSELKKDFEILSQTFERAIDAKEAFIRALGNEMIESEEMYAMAFRSHLHVTDYLLDLHNERLDMVTREYCQQLEMICEEFDMERAILKDHHHKQMLNFDDILFAIEQLRTEEEKEDRNEYEMMEIEIKNKSLEGKQALRKQLGAKIEDLWQLFRHLLLTVNEMNEDAKATFEVIKQKDDKRSKEIDMNMRKIARVEKQISRLRVKIAARTRGYKKEGTLKDDDDDDEFNKEERIRLAHDFQQAKYDMNQIRLRARERLIRLTVDSNNSIKELRKLIDKGVSILKLAEICRKLETEEEKLVPFYVSSLSEWEEEEHLMAAAKEAPSVLLVEAMRDCSELENFWKRHNKVLLDKLSLEKEKETLMSENQQLRRLLKQYMDNISVNDQVMSQNNPLLMVKNNVESTTGSLTETSQCCCKKPSTTKTVIEAAHVAKQLLD